MMILMMALPLLGLLLFYFFPFGMALPIYLLFLFVSGLMYYGMFTVMGRKRKVRTGFEDMMGKEALALEDIDPEGKVRIDDEVWSARAPQGRFFKGQKARICGHEGLTLIVEGLSTEEKP